MEKEKTKVRKLMLLSPEYYDSLNKKNALEPPPLLKIEQQFLSILQDPTLTTTQKLLKYNNLFIINFNTKHHSINSSFPNRPREKGVQTYDDDDDDELIHDRKKIKMDSRDIQTSNIAQSSNFTQNFSPLSNSSEKAHSISSFISPTTSQHHSSVNTSPSHPMEKITENLYPNIPKLKPNERFLGFDAIDISKFQTDFFNNLSEQFDDHNLNVKDYNLEHLEDHNKSFVKATNTLTHQHAIVEKPLEMIRFQKRFAKPTKEKANQTTSPKTRAQKKNAVARKNSSKNWTNYESSRK